MSGKTALHEALCESQSFFSISPHFDFDLIRLPDGINDLLISFQFFSEHHQAVAIHRFLSLLNACDSYGGILDRKSRQKLSYPDHFSLFSEFKEGVFDYLMSEGHFCNHPHSYVYESRFRNFSRRAKTKLFNSNEDNCYVSHRTYEDVKVFFQNAVRELLLTANGYKGQDFYVLNNLNFVESLGFSSVVFPHVRQIAVVRNPLDVLTDLHTKNLVHNANPEVSIKINNANNPTEFLFGYNKKLIALKKYAEKSNDLLVVRFEDLVFKYVETMCKVFHHLEFDFINNKGSFPLDSSKNNVSIWKSNPMAIELHRKMNGGQFEGVSFYYPDLCHL